MMSIRDKISAILDLTVLRGRGINFIKYDEEKDIGYFESIS